MSEDRSDFVVEAFTNHLGQVVNPGDEVFYVGRSGQSIVTNKATFEGVYYNDVYSWKTKTTERRLVAVRVGGIPAKKWVYDTDANGRYVSGSGRHVDIIRKATLPRKRVYKLAV